VPRPSNTTEFTSKAKIIHVNRYDYRLVHYIKNNIKVKIICPIHGIFEQIPNSHLMGKGCAKCGGSVRSTTEEFVERATGVHGNQYNYSCTKYISSVQKVEIVCSFHGSFWQTPEHHLQGHGCNECGKDVKKSSISLFSERAAIIHNNKYNYLLARYVNNYTKVIIVCPEHGQFEQAPNSHLAGQGCPTCAPNHNRGIKHFIAQADLIHDGFYDYSLAIYVNGKTKTTIICPDHGEFQQTPASHLNGQGCPKCIHIISSPEIKWLDSLGIALNRRNISLPGLGRKRVDGYDPKTNTVYEFHGDYWHGNPLKFNPNDMNEIAGATFGELYARTIERENLIRAAGYNLITIWEGQFEKLVKEAKKQEVEKEKLKNVSIL